MQTDTVDILKVALGGEPLLELAVLIGSRATGRPGPESDWDIAIQWERGVLPLERLGLTETLRRRLASLLGVTEAAIDLIDLPLARLAMRAVIAEEGIPLKGEDGLPWQHFLRRTWRDLEEYYWEQTYAA
ncbi:nucleotidyltransferase family protein [Geobacter sp.]|uniref:nucleotidyltransferase family protein n=1 Tax=Geobacter sp. TaxID=46610 RepID=UPI00263146F1|nr:nucleotidyltransferase domain-containing protein [Geobacter sp.]